MSNLQFSFFGAWQITRNHNQNLAFPVRKELALLAWLVVEQPRSQSRERLCGLLWPDEAPNVARNNLRVILSRLQKRLGESSDEQPHLHIDRHAIHFNPNSDHNCDVLEFQRIVQTIKEHGHAARATCPACCAAMQRAVELYQGDFLSGLFLDNCEEFEEWIASKREALRHLLLEMLGELTTSFATSGNLQIARRYALLQVELEPLSEPLRRQLMQILAKLGERSAALTQFNTLKQLLATELAVEPNRETTQLYEQIRNGNGGNSAIQKSANGRSAVEEPLPPVEVERRTGTARLNIATPPCRHNLPLRLTPFSGRAEELAELSERLQKPRYRLITLAGAGGMGKSRLAVEVARRQLTNFADGVFFVSLAAIQRVEVVPETIAAAINLNLEAHDKSIYDQLLAFLRQKEILLILDNLEQLLAEESNQAGEAAQPTMVDLILDLLQNSSKLLLLVTSRERLNIQSEDLFLLEGLPVPSADVEMSVIEQAEEFAAIELFVERAQRLHKKFRLTPENFASVIRICQLVTGIPLAIELAVTWLDCMTPVQIAEQLAQTLNLLATTQRDVPLAHRSIRTVFETSWQLLSCAEQLLFAQLSLFRGGFQRQAVTTIIKGSGRLFTQLQNKSMLHSFEANRYTLHELLRQFAAEKLQLYPPEVIHELRNCHCNYYLTLVAECEPELEREQSLHARTTISADLDNLRGAWQWAVEQQAIDWLGLACDGLAHFYEVMVFDSEAEIAIGSALKAVRAIVPQRAEATAVFAKLLALQADIAYLRARFAESLRLAEEAIALAKGIAIPLVEARATLRIANIHINAGNFANAKVYLQSTQQLLFQHPASPHGVRVLYCLSWIANSEADAPVAMQFAQRALQLCQAHRFRRSEALILEMISRIYFHQGNFVQAQQQGEAALKIIHEMKLHIKASHLLDALATICDRTGNFSQAHDYYRQGLALAREQGDLLTEALIVSNMSVSADCCGMYQEALQAMQQVAFLYQELKMLGNGHIIDMNLALQYHHLGDNAPACHHAQIAIERTQQMGDRSLEVYGWTILGHTLAGVNALSEAAEAYQRALQVQQEVGATHLQPEAWAGLARVALTQHDVVEAYQWVQQILCFLETGSLDAAEEPARVCHTCYQVLQQMGDSRAGVILQTAYNNIQERANKIVDTATRHSFLHNVAAHRQIVCEYEQTVTASRPTG